MPAHSATPARRRLLPRLAAWRSKNPEMLERAFLSVLAEGDIEEAIRLAEQVVKLDRTDRIARLVIGIHALKQKKYGVAQAEPTQSIRGPITDLAATLLAAWASYGAGDSKTAIDSIDKLQGADWYALFKDLHAGLILDLAGNKKEAGKRFERAHKLDATALRLVEAYGSWLSRNGKKDDALKMFKAFDAQLPRHPLIVEEMASSGEGQAAAAAGRRCAGRRRRGAVRARRGARPPRRRRPRPGLSAARALSGAQSAVGAAVARRSLRAGEESAACHQDLRARAAEFAVAAQRRNPARGQPRHHRQDRRGQAALAEAAQGASRDIEAIMALGSILRGRKEFAECAQVYSKGIATIANPEKPNWLIYYFRGICNERAKNWAEAEADLKQALKLYPDQPHVLNYLGYSWIDQGINLDEGMRMIRRAVEQRPDDGYIVDSLGWAYFRVGNYDEAVKNLERAVELKPEDPTINDHLGDAYAKTGRTLEAQFQWSHARDLKPEPEDLVKIKQKLATGLPEETSRRRGGKKKPDGG